MRPFRYESAETLRKVTQGNLATGQGQVDAPVQILAGGTTLIDLMKLDVLRPESVVDINPLRREHSEIALTREGLRLGALATMSAASDHPEVIREYPAIADSLRLAASAQLRNMATLGGNVLQRTRCPYFRDTSWTACNKRNPGSGCAAAKGVNRNHAVLGVDDSCIAQYPGDLGVVLAALDARVDLSGPRGTRRIAFSELHRPAAGEPHLETTLRRGEIITSFLVPAGRWNQRSLYLKVRDRASYEFAIASAAVALDLEGDVVREVRIGLGGMAYRPWRASEAEELLAGKPLNEGTANEAATIALRGAVTSGHNDYKPELGRRTLVRALMEAKERPLRSGAAA